MKTKETICLFASQSPFIWISAWRGGFHLAGVQSIDCYRTPGWERSGVLQVDMIQSSIKGILIWCAYVICDFNP